MKLNANEFPAIAQGFGITRVPTDVILTPDGQILSKVISPATPAAYVAETTNVANQYASQSGQAYQVATASPPNPPVLNQAYAESGDRRRSGDADRSAAIAHRPSHAARTATNVFAPPAHVRAATGNRDQQLRAADRAPSYASPNYMRAELLDAAAAGDADPDEPGRRSRTRPYAPPTQPQPCNRRP